MRRSPLPGMQPDLPATALREYGCQAHDGQDGAQAHPCHHAQLPWVLQQRQYHAVYFCCILAPLTRAALCQSAAAGAMTRSNDSARRHLHHPMRFQSIHHHAWYCRVRSGLPLYAMPWAAHPILERVMQSTFFGIMAPSTRCCQVLPADSCSDPPAPPCVAAVDALNVVLRAKPALPGS